LDCERVDVKVQAKADTFVLQGSGFRRPTRFSILLLNMSITSKLIFGKREHLFSLHIFEQSKGRMDSLYEESFRLKSRPFAFLVTLQKVNYSIKRLSSYFIEI
jgi:hypothetical protein